MTEAPVDGVQRATSGSVSEAAVDEWLRCHVRSRPGTDRQEVAMRSGRVNAVFGLHLDDGSPQDQ